MLKGVIAFASLLGPEFANPVGFLYSRRST
jgi:hypothetical protein